MTRKRIDRHIWVSIFTHLIVISMVFILPDLIFTYAKPSWKVSTAHIYSMYIKAGVYISIFYIDYFLIFNHLRSPKIQRKIWSFIVSNILLIILGLLALYYLQLWIVEPIKAVAPSQPHHAHISEARQLLMHTSFVIRDCSMMVLTIALALALRIAENWSKIEKHRQQLLSTQKTDELQSLKSQLNPHFLFNTLNTIYALIAVSPDQAQDAVHKLSTLLRYVLYENPAKVKLSREIDFVKSYISLMEMRLGTDMVHAHFANSYPSDIEVPPLVFITLIENAFKHGNTGVKGQPIQISISATPQGVVTCRTSNHFIAKGDGDANPAGGIGISNLRRRLQLIYGDCASLTTTVEGDIYTAILTIQTLDCS